MRQKFDVTGNLEKFCKILGTKHALIWAWRPRLLGGDVLMCSCVDGRSVVARVSTPSS